MDEVRKSIMTVDGDSVRVSMPFAKVDEAKRLVSGYATLDNLDTQDDIVLAEASAKAFSRARGNIREMHQPLAVGRMVDFREDEFFYTDPDTGEGKFYRGIFVTARVSEGAEDTWKKVLDGTLTGFSIGGEINKSTSQYVEEAGRVVRFIEDYDLIELSLVDNPANQLANVLSIQKSAGGSMTVKGMAVETDIENVFICANDDTVVVKNTETESCPMCGTKMENAGWFESGEGRAEKVASIVAKFRNPAEKEAAPISKSEGGVEMGDKEETKVEEDVETPETEEIAETEEETVEEEVDVDEVDETDVSEDETPDEILDEGTEISKKIDELHEAVKTSLEESKTETLEKVAELEKKVDEATQKFLNKASELESKMGEFGEKLETSKNRLSELENSLEKMNSAEAFKKSADLEDEGRAVKSVQSGTSWNGAFSGKKPSGGFSVDNLM